MQIELQSDYRINITTMSIDMEILSADVDLVIYTDARKKYIPLPEDVAMNIIDVLEKDDLRRLKDEYLHEDHEAY